MTHRDEVDTELWEPGTSGTRIDLESLLEVYRFDFERRPLDVAALGRRRRAGHRRLRRFLAVAAAAALIVLSVQGTLRWRLTWPEGQPWTFSSAAAGSNRDLLPPGGILETDRNEPALVRIARIGWMTVSGGSSLSLRATGGGRHSVDLNRGELHVSVWAPPFSVFVHTPAGQVTDLGCEFIVRSGDTATTVEVISGWVQLENRYGELLVPAGARSVMPSDAAPGVPVYQDASRTFREAVEKLEGGEGIVPLRPLLQSARAKDTMTLLHLAMRHDDLRAPLLERAYALDPRIEREALQAAVGGDDRAVWRWMDGLPLPSPKSWLRNWRDAFAPRL